MSSLTTSMIPLGVFKYVSAQDRGRNASAWVWSQASSRDGSLGLAARAADVQLGLAGQSCTSEGDLHQGQWWGFCSMRSLPSACRRRVAPLLVQLPPFAGGEERRQQVHLGQLDSRTLSAPARPIARPHIRPHIRHIGALSPPMKQPPSTPAFPYQQAEKPQYNQHVLACNPSVRSTGDASSRQRGSEARFRAF